MIHMYIGPPRSGKSYASLKEILEELVWGNRIIITNLSIDLGKLNEYVATEHPEFKGDINQRIRILDEAQSKEFYRYRRITGDIGAVSREDSLKGVHLPYGDHAGDGVLYVIDEAHIPFDAREWATTGPELTFYNSQHGKLSDEAIFITQFEKLIEQRVRAFAQDFYYFQNMGLERFMTYFHKPQMFTMEVHRKPPSGPGSHPPLEKRHYRMNFKLANCYDTSAGVGIKGRNKPEKKGKKGLNIFWLLVPIALVVYLLTRAPDWVTKGASLLTDGANQLEEKAEDAVRERATNGPPLPTQEAQPKVPPVEKPHATGYIESSRGTTVTLSDGTRKSTAPHVFETIRIKGSVYEFKQKQEKALTRDTWPPNMATHENKQ